VLGLVAVSPEVAAAARKSGRHDDGQGRTNDDARDNRDEREEKTQNGQESERKNDAGAEDRDTSDKSEKSEKHVRNEDRTGNNDSSDQNGSDSEKSRGDSSRRNADSDSSSRESSSADDHSNHHGGRHVREFEQKADAPADDTPTNSTPSDNAPDATTVTPANPNVVINDVPDTSANDLIVQANDNVVATVSSSGGFAFARSGGVTAVTGPDGASIIQTGDVSTGTDGNNPTEPSDNGGNNDMDFSS